jgi:protein-L-isoaspartate(D-aspartate) O-methyltransferase
MGEFAKARANMVDGQLRTSDVTDPAVLAAFGEVPRERFVPKNKVPLSYSDLDVPLNDGAPARFLLEPAPFAKLLQLASIGPLDVVLDVGTGTGYGAAILARIASSVVALEEDDGLAQRAETILNELGVSNAVVVRGALREGHVEEGPYDAIILEGAVDDVPAALLRQLKNGGRLVALVGRGRAARATVFVRSGEEFGRRVAFDAAAPPLPGFQLTPRFEFTF